MGNKYEVHSWKLYTVNEHGEKTGKPHYELVYAGKSLICALLISFREKIKDIGCVKIYWR